MTTKPETYVIHNGNISAAFLSSGDLYTLKNNDISINQLSGNHLDGSLNNIYLRIHTEEGIESQPLLGVNSNSQFSISEQKAKWKGRADSITYEVTFHLSSKDIWFWEIELDGSNQKKIDLIYTQDISLANTAAVRSNEAYVSQYLDHSAHKNNTNSFVICSRQNQEQQGNHPYLQQGALQSCTGFSTDGFQFYGKSYKFTNVPEALTKETLPNKIYQYEFANIALQTEKKKLQKRESFVFYALYKEHHPNAVQQPETPDLVDSAWEEVKSKAVKFFQPFVKMEKQDWIGSPVCGEKLTLREISEHFPNRILEEFKDKKLLSFFTNTYEHIVLPEKEHLVERPHGHILMSGNNHHVVADTITSNHYIYGIFNSQIAIGNVNMNKMLSNSRNSLNVMKSSGQRIYLELEGKYHLLTMPSLYEMGFNYSRWYYKLNNDLLIFSTYTTVENTSITLEAISVNHLKYKFLISNHITMHPNEDEVDFQYKMDNKTLIIEAGSQGASKEVYPHLKYFMQFEDTDFEVCNEQKIIKNGSRSTPFLLLETEKTSTFRLSMEGSLTGERIDYEYSSFREETERYRNSYKRLMNNFHLSHPAAINNIEKLNVIAWWYTHNMLVHFSSPHGLEQYSGAAWGTRDVSQGPAEYFLATGEDETVRSIIIELYRHQYEDHGNWPQWFMFDNYHQIQQEDSHGDIIIWPLKILGTYIQRTGDFSILSEKVAYTRKTDFLFTEEKYSVIDHVQKQLKYIRTHFLHETCLSAYDGGDWDDTLQPANSSLKQYLVSSWTVALTYESINCLAELLSHEAFPSLKEELTELAQNIFNDFQQYIMTDDTIPGFIYMENTDRIGKLLHPDDEQTGITYRLLPMQESIISELFTKGQAETHTDIIKKHLYFPDGVRLMNQPANYQGGVSTYFKRAEQASNFGREIGLQYVHAHIRYIEAMAKLGDAQQTWKGLYQINPILLQETVPNAEFRQSNAYFSSSDGNFMDRYDARENFNQLRDGTVSVKGGWRIYSSGPGIYMNQLISHILGVRRQLDTLVIDPVLPLELDGLTFTFELENKPVLFHYHLDATEDKITLNGKPLVYSLLENPYRSGGKAISLIDLKEKLITSKNKMDIYMSNA